MRGIQFLDPHTVRPRVAASVRGNFDDGVVICWLYLGKLSTASFAVTFTTIADQRSTWLLSCRLRDAEHLHS